LAGCHILIIIIIISIIIIVIFTHLHGGLKELLAEEGLLGLLGAGAGGLARTDAVARLRTQAQRRTVDVLQRPVINDATRPTRESDHAS
jgi:hypothetical protein